VGGVGVNAQHSTCAVKSAGAWAPSVLCLATCMVWWGGGSRLETVPQGCGAGTHARAGHGGKGGAGRVGCFHNLDDIPVLGLLHLPPQHRALISGIALYTRVGGL
jgi:hypothetical protein